MWKSVWTVWSIYADDNYQLAVNSNKTEALKELQMRVIEAEQWM